MAEKQIELPDFDEWVKNYEHKPVVYNAAFDSESGRVLSVGPDHTVNEKQYENISKTAKPFTKRLLSIFQI